MRKCSDMPYHIGVVLKLHLSYKQRSLVVKNAGAERSVYNHLVACGNEIYRLSKTASCVPSDRKRIDTLRHMSGSAANVKNSLPYLYEKDIDCQTVENGIRNYRAAWKNMRERHTGVPTFHKRGSGFVWHTNCHYKGGDTGLSDGTVRFTDSSHLTLPKLGRVRFDGSPKLVRALMQHNADTRIGTVTIWMDAVGECWVSLQVSSEHPFHEELPKAGKSIGIDLNLLELANASDGSAVANPRFRKTMDEKIIRLQKSLSRKGERAKADGRHLIDSRNYQKDRIRLARLHRKVARQRDDYLDCVSKRLVENQDLIAAEDLRVRNMLKNHRLAKAISDAGWRILLIKIMQKASMYGRTAVLVPPQYTTQTCSVCGHVMRGDERIPLSVREWDCPACGTHHLRDMNAGQNILARAERILTAHAAGS